MHLDDYPIPGLIILSLTAIILIWMVRKKPFVIVKILWIFQITLRDTPPDDPTKARQTRKRNGTQR